jgi:DNA-binding MarR family transcriptional regulator
MLSAIANHPELTIGQLAHRICLSQATATTILDRLEKDQLAQRYRSESDKRRIYARLTEQGLSVLKEAPEPMDSSFIEQFERLKPHERSSILAALLQVGDMMEPKSNQDSDLLPEIIDFPKAG